MSLFRRPSAEPLWRDEFSVHTADDRYVTRRQLTKFLTLTSLGMFAGHLWILARAWLGREAAAPGAAVVARVADVPVGGSTVFRYPGEGDPCILVRLGEDRWVAYSQKCTHLSCAVYWEPSTARLACPCHVGYFAVEDGAVLQGPPPRPLPRILIERRGDVIVALGMQPGKGPGRG